MHGCVNKFGETLMKYLQLRFIDSLRFRPLSLQTVYDSLAEEQFVEMTKYFPDEGFSN